MITKLAEILNALGVPPQAATSLGVAVGLLVILLSALIVHRLARGFVAAALEAAFLKSSNKWDDVLVRHGFMRRLALFAPLVVAYLGADFFLAEAPLVSSFFKRLLTALFVVAGVRTLDSLLSAARDIHSSSELARERPVRGYIEALKIVIYLLGAILVVSILTGKSPLGVFSVLGGFTVVLMLVFKDTILGFVASLQIAGHNMVRVGDWIEMPKFGADGDVIDISIHTVKVRNWDKTITTIPTYTLVSDSFRNWRGMSESGGRRIKRNLLIDLDSIRFCSEEMLERFSKIGLVAGYVNQRQAEIERYNDGLGLDTTLLVNGRRQTNIGVFRAYVVQYLRHHPKIHQSMTFLVRQLEPTGQGLPLQIYVFAADQVWANYEAIQADIFDHLIAAVPEFGLRLYQAPSGYDLRETAKGFAHRSIAAG